MLERRNAYPDHYLPGDLDIDLEIHFQTHTGEHIDATGEPLVAGTRGTWVLRIANHQADLPEGSALTLVRLNCQIAFLLQCDAPRGRDYCTLESDSRAELHLSGGRTAVNLLTVHVVSGTFKKGETCTLRLGDRRRGGAGSEVFWSTTSGQFLLAVARPGEQIFTGVRGNPYEFRVRAHPVARLLRLLGPTLVAASEPFALHLGVFDRNRNLVEDYQGEVELIAPEHVLGLPDSFAFSPADGGLKVFAQTKIVHPGVYRIPLRAPEGDFLSNPILVQADPPRRVFWGDVHAHGWGDSTMHLMHLRSAKLDPLARHHQARQVGRLDFACPGPMSMDPQSREQLWKAYAQACEKADEPGHYAPFLAYEAHPEAGDRQIFYKNPDEPAPPPMRAPMDQVDERYGRRDDVFMEVHIGGEPPRWDRYRPRRERLLEVSSGFGNAEWLLQKALALGYRPAVCGASDLHLGLLGGPRAVEPFRGRFGQKYPMRQRDSGYGSGPLTAVFAAELSRDHIWHGLETRQTYATSGARLFLDLTCNGRPAGAQLRAGEQLEIRLTCHACAPIDRIDLICGTCRIHTWRPGAWDFEAALCLAAGQCPGAWLYARAHQVDGEYAWTSPIYLEHPHGVPQAKDLPAWNAEERPPLNSPAENAATPYMQALLRYLECEEEPGRFHQLTPVGVFEYSVGRCALFQGYWGEERLPLSIRFFFEFEIPKIRFDFGWRDYGAVDELELGAKLMEQYG